MRIIACVNQKGGVGKTTLSSNVAYAMSKAGYKVLAIDMDPQGQLGQSFGHFHHQQYGIDAVFTGKARFETCIREIQPNLHLVPCGEELYKLEVTQVGKGRGLLLKKAIKQQISSYDFIIMDCPPSSGFLVVNALAAATELLIPVTPDFFGMSGLSQLMATVKKFEASVGDYEKHWIVINRMQRRKLAAEVKEKLHHYFGKKLVPTIIHERAVYAESPSHGQPVLAYAPSSQASIDIAKLSQNILQYEGVQDAV